MNLNNSYELYQNLDSLLEAQTEIAEEITLNIENIKAASCEKNLKYSTAFDGLGPLCPSLVIDKITSGYKKGRLVSKPPKRQRFAICNFDRDNRPLYIEKYNQFGCDLTYYFYDKSNVLWAVPFIGHTDSLYPADIHRMIFAGGRIIEYSYMTKSSIWHEIYEYLDSGENIICNQYYYVPNLNSDKSAAPGCKNSPLSVRRIDISMNKNKVDRLRYYEISDSIEKLTYEYSCKNK